MILLSEDFAFPGEFLTVEEEFISGTNTFEDDEGNIYSTKVGSKEFDEKEREVSVKEKNPSNDLLELGSIIIGRVALIKESFVALDILSAEKNGKQLICSFPSAKLMVSKVARFHVNNLRDEFRTGDFVKAKVINISKYGIDVTTTYPELGVIKAFCSKCRSQLSLFDKTLKCVKCSSIEKRKLSSEFK